MKRTLGVVAVATFAAVAAGLVVASAAMLVDEPHETLVHSFRTSTGFASLLVAAAAGSLPISIPAGIVGGILAASALATHSGSLSAKRWIARGLSGGAALGAGGAVAWFGLMNLGDGAMLLLLLLVAPIGALAGAGVGALVGAYCACISRQTANAVVVRP